MPDPIRLLPLPIESFSGRYRFLSNFYPCEMDVAGVRYPTLEHAFQAEKTTNMTEREIIRSARTPGQAKALGRRVTLRENWNESAGKTNW